jgi:hypothetical protein
MPDFLAGYEVDFRAALESAGENESGGRRAVQCP